MLLIVLWFIFIDTNAGAGLLNCPNSDVKFEKILGLRPPNSTYPSLLYKPADNNKFRPITAECVAKCQSNDNCASFVLLYSVSRCYWFEDNLNDTADSTNIVDDDVAWFIKKCYYGKICNKLWIFERIPGATLIGNDSKILPEPLSRMDCQQFCLNETEFSCRSAKFQISIKEAAKGRCILSSADRHRIPNAYRVSGFDDEYFENQCSPNHNQESEFCAYEEYENVTLAHRDAFFEKKSKDECQALCEGSKSFNCWGFTTSTSDDCFLHSEDSKVFGPTLLKEAVGSTYYEKARCLNITVSCSETYMTVRYEPEVNFYGKIYMQGYSEDTKCFANGQGKFKSVTLKISLLNGICGIIKADGPINRTLLSGTMSIQYNPTIQTQNDRLIRVGCIFGNDSKILIGTGIRLSTSTSNKGSSLIGHQTNMTTSPVVEMRILDLKTQEEVSDTQIGQELELVIQLKSADSYEYFENYPESKTRDNFLKIFVTRNNLRTCGIREEVEHFLIPDNTERSKTSLWKQFIEFCNEKSYKIDETVTLIQFANVLEDYTSNNPSVEFLDIWASHLVAMTERSDESIFLLDDRGCPTNLNVFPQMEKMVTSTSVELVANFQAFKFASSPIVRFSVIVQFCPDICPVINCGQNVTSNGRKKRQTSSHAIQTVRGTTIVKINRSEFEERSGLNEMPLEYFMVVRDPKSTSDRLIFGENNRILVAGYDYSTDEVCLDYSLVIGLIVLWILVQIFFVTGCIVLVKRYKRYYQHESMRQSLEELHKNFGLGFSNLESRRVRWADNDSMM